jgi:hypothetical protein
LSEDRPWEYTITEVTKRDNVTFLVSPNDTVVRRSLSTSSLKYGAAETHSWLQPSAYTLYSVNSIWLIFCCTHFLDHDISRSLVSILTAKLLKILQAGYSGPGRHVLMHSGLSRRDHAVNGARDLHPWMKMDIIGARVRCLVRPLCIFMCATCLTYPDHT